MHCDVSCAVGRSSTTGVRRSGPVPLEYGAQRDARDHRHAHDQQEGVVGPVREHQRQADHEHHHHHGDGSVPAPQPCPAAQGPAPDPLLDVRAPSPAEAALRVRRQAQLRDLGVGVGQLPVVEVREQEAASVVVVQVGEPLGTLPAGAPREWLDPDVVHLGPGPGAGPQGPPRGDPGAGDPGVRPVLLQQDPHQGHDDQHDHDRRPPPVPALAMGTAGLEERVEQHHPEQEQIRSRRSSPLAVLPLELTLAHARTPPRAHRTGARLGRG
jgi:hypothetical protein